MLPLVVFRKKNCTEIKFGLLQNFSLLFRNENKIIYIYPLLSALATWKVSCFPFFSCFRKSTVFGNEENRKWIDFTDKAIAHNKENFNLVINAPVTY